MAPEDSSHTWRQHLLHERALLQTRFYSDSNTSGLLKRHCRLIDDLLLDIWRNTIADSQLSLVAVGGYGRGELFPHSDVDLLILLPEHNGTASNRCIETLIGLLWDIGLTVGHSVRTLHECATEAGKDITIQTNLLEARYLAGSKPLYQELKQASKKLLQPAGFYLAKMQEQRQRHAHFNDTAYNLEPNLKDGPGGLRDLQQIIWIVRSLELGGSWQALAAHGLISSTEARQLRYHERHLQRLRVSLHYLAKRREDRLLFDYQNALAGQLGFTNTPRRRASERLMHSFYNSAKFISLMNEMLLQLLEARIWPRTEPAIPINSRFEIRHGLLDVKHSSTLRLQPDAILESFLLLEQHPELKGMSPRLSRALYRAKNLVNREFRQSAENQARFMTILQQPLGVTRALQLMNRYGILGKYIPAFGRIVGKMQHDLFHVYTVDEHTLNVLRNLRHFALSRFNHEFPLCSKLFSEFDAPHLLYLAALFHDIAKGRGGNHSLLGAADARRFCRQHDLSDADTKLVVWLVKSHLVMSSVAQKSDLSDPSVVSHFARLMENERRLTALYLLTVADIRGTSPKVWNTWKARLLEELFFVTRRFLRGKASDIDTEVEQRKLLARTRLTYHGLDAADYETLWQYWGRQYFLRYEAEEIAWHTRLLSAHATTSDIIVCARLSPAGYGIQVMIYLADRDDLFAHICRFFEHAGYTIAEARVYTTTHGYALDSFIILDPSSKTISYRDLLNYIEYELRRRLQSKDAPGTPLRGRISRQVKHMPIPTRVSIKPDENSNHHIIDIVASDRPGLLSRLSSMLLKHRVRLHNAKINTLGNRAEDTFVISGQAGKRLEAESLQLLQEDLLKKI